MATQVARRLKEVAIFFCGFLKQPIKVGTGFQSSASLAREFERVLDYLNLSDGCVVELGAGLGRLTERIVGRLGPSTRLICFESEPMFAEYLKRKYLGDPRVTVVQDRAEKLGTWLRELGVDRVSAVVSAVPLSGRRNDEILRAVREALCPNGRMIQMALVRRRYFEEEQFKYLDRRFVLWNLPPEMLHVCEKPATADSAPA